MATPGVRPPGEVSVAVVGISERPTCGVRDHATLLAAALAGEGVVCTTHWLTRRASSARAQRREVREWLELLARDLERERPDAILLHYSVFAYSYKGLPTFVAPVLKVLRRAGVPIVAVMHEFAYPWRYGGWRGAVWAVSQRIVLAPLVRACAGVMVTADVRSEWLRSRRWLRCPPVVVAPVFSNLPPASAQGRGAQPGEAGPRAVGLFGFSYQGVAVDVVLDAIATLQARGEPMRLRLLGAPGADSDAGRQWREEAVRHGVGEALSFSGALPAQELSDELASCALLLTVDAVGPSSRKGTLAASLASGVALLAIDGRLTWRELVQRGGARVVPPVAAQLADAIGELLADEPARARLAAAGSAFYAQHMAVEHSARAAAALIGQALGAAGPSSGA